MKKSSARVTVARAPASLKRRQSRLGRKRRSVLLTEDEADAIICLRRMKEQDIPLEQVMRRLRNDMER